ncbi:hypothetical protein RvY_01449 [Ramazzottius varieornatus]|uniref:Uncharacterized protein n=1 Tax=Ramazzottius varieornatus TaxID=947166 RepID=A0A1D1UJW2_RAMVA|nr:hypothetical protein RvY_01449 [Ramazzottius varieornatus]
MDGASLTHLVSECLEDYKIKIPEGSGGAKNKRILIEKLWKQMRPDKPLRPDNGEVSTATVLKVLGNRTFSSARLQVKPPLRTRMVVAETKSVTKPVGKKDSRELKAESNLSFIPIKGDDRDRRKVETADATRSSVVGVRKSN